MNDAHRVRAARAEPLAELRELSAVHVLPVLEPLQGGPYYSVPGLCAALNDGGVRTTLLTVGAEPAAPTAIGEAAAVRYCGQDFTGIGLLERLRLSRQMREVLEREVASADVVHNHSLWLMPNVYAARAAHAARKPLIISPRGTLMQVPLTTGRLRKSLFWHLMHKADARQAFCFHATSDAERDQLRQFGVKAPIAVIPTGIELPEPPAPRAGVRSDERVLLFLGRIHPIKGLDPLVRAWSRIERRFPDWRLRIVGPSELGHAAEIGTLIRQLGIERAAIEEPVWGEDKARLLASADLFVLPSFSENFGVAVAEALAAGKPVVAGRGTPWGGLETNGCGWWTRSEPDALEEVLAEAMSLPDARRDRMGGNGRRWMERDFQWRAVAQRMQELYRWAAGECPRPNWVSD